jgi:hypothetical protein
MLLVTIHSKSSPENIHSSIPLIAKAWSETYPGERFIYKFMEDNYREQYFQNRILESL